MIMALTVKPLTLIECAFCEDVLPNLASSEIGAAKNTYICIDCAENAIHSINKEAEDGD